MRIAQICPTPFPSLGGPSKNYEQFHAALKTLPICFVRPGEGVTESAVVPMDVRIDTLDIPGIWRYYLPDPRALRYPEEVIQGLDCLIIHNFYRFPCIWGAQIATRHKIPYIIVLHGILDPWVFNKNRWAKKLWMAMYGTTILRNASAVLCATVREREKFLQFHQASRVAVVPWAVPTFDVSKHSRQRDVIRRTLGIAPTDRALVFLGRLDSMKRPLETVRIVASLRIPDLKFIVVGPDADVSGEALANEARRLGWEGLRLVGPKFRQEKYDYLCAADAYISLSSRENFNFTAAEAMICRLPVILSPGNDLGWEFVGQGFSWQLKSGDPAEAVAAIRQFVDTPRARLDEMGRNAAAWAEANLNEEGFARLLQELVHGVIAESGPTKGKGASLG